MSCDVRHSMSLCCIAFTAGLDEMAGMADALDIPIGVTTPVVYPV